MLSRSIAAVGVSVAILAGGASVSAQRAIGDAYLSTHGPGRVTYHGHCKPFSLDIRVDSQRGDHFKGTVQTFHHKNGHWVAKYDANHIVNRANRWISYRQIGVVCERGRHLIKVRVRAFYDTFDPVVGRDRHFVGSDSRRILFRVR
jgi:hypothetical protein